MNGLRKTIPSSTLSCLFGAPAIHPMPAGAMDAVAAENPGTLDRCLSLLRKVIRLSVSA